MSQSNQPNIARQAGEMLGINISMALFHGALLYFSLVFLPVDVFAFEYLNLPNTDPLTFWQCLALPVLAITAGSVIKSIVPWGS